MFKTQLASLIVASAVIMIGTPQPSLADSRHRSQPHVERHADNPRRSGSKHELRHDQARRDRSKHRHRARQHKPTRRDVYKPYYRPRHHHNHRKVAVSGRHRSYHPHGHHLHIHDTYCPVVVHRQYVYAAPTWTIWYQTHRATFPQASIHLRVAPHHGEGYIDGHFLGLARTFREGSVQIPVAPGPHTVQLRYGGADYTHHIHVRPGATTQVSAERL